MDWPARKGAIEIDHMQGTAARITPAPRHLDGIFAIDRGVVCAPLAEPDALAALEVDSRENRQPA